MKIKFNRVMLKISGEALMGGLEFGIDPTMLAFVAKEIKTVVDLGVQLSVVVGGGNIFRGVKSESLGIERTSADQIGMLGTVLNGLALRGVLEKKGLKVRIQAAIAMNDVAEPYVLGRAIRHLEKGRIVIFVAGTGNPYFTTDTAAVLRARETCSEVILKATKVDGLYEADPEIDSEAKFIRSANYMEVVTRQLKVMDTTAISLAMEGRLPLIIFNINREDNIRRAVLGEEVGTFIGD